MYTRQTGLSVPGGRLPSVRDGLAIASLVSAFLVPVLGMIFGHVSNHQANQVGQEKSGLAIAGLILSYIFTGIAALIMIIVLAAGASATSTATASRAPTHLPKPSAPPANPALAKPRTLLRASGNGNYTTAKFIVGGSGDYDVYWSYQPIAAFAGQSVNFMVDADNDHDLNFNDPNQLGTGGSGVVHVYGDAGSHFLTITSEADWTVTVVSAAGPVPAQASSVQPAQAAAITIDHPVS